MLKIREEKMQELEKFGFKEGIGCYTYASNGISCLFIHCRTRRIESYINTVNNADYDKLYDLIKADMVEKENE